MNLKKASLEIGKEGRYFGIIKTRTPDKFNLMLSLGDGNIVRGYYKYRANSVEKVDSFMELYNILEYGRNMSAFSRYSGYSTSMLVNKALKAPNNDMQYGTYHEMDALINKMEEFIRLFPTKLKGKQNEK